MNILILFVILGLKNTTHFKIMKIRTLFVTVLLVLAAYTTLFAKGITKDQARITAKNFITERAINHQVNCDANSISIVDITTFESEGQPAVYAFSNNGQGFVLIPADDAITPVLGYSFESNMSDPGTNPTFDYLISDYIDQVKYVRIHALTATAQIQHAWDSYLSGELNDSPQTDVTVGPLVTTMWNQGTPYNEFCPTEPSGAHLVPTGCVATAMSMIMDYYRYPLVGNGMHSYNCPGYGVQSANFGNTSYDWDMMQNSMSTLNGEGALANALLCYHAGVAVDMTYAPDGSGAYSNQVPAAVKNYFKYSPTTTYVTRSSYTATAWDALLTAQIDLKYPLYYSGHGTAGGHAWLCDGYQVTGSTQLFHFNFGWGGQDNGYFTSANPNGFPDSQGIIKDFYPNSSMYPYTCSSKTLEFIKGSIEDGSGPIANYGDNLDCNWLIAPSDTVKSYTVKFIRFDLKSGDSLYFYKGTNSGATRVGAFSGSTLPSDLVVTGDRLYIRFVTDGSDNAGGWLIEFNATLPTLCAATTNMYESSGSFTDGSLGYNYKNNTLCKFKINPPYATGLTLSFDEFDLAEGDNIRVMNYTTQELLATLSGNSIPAPIVIPSGGFWIIFQSDAYYTASGFKANYYTGNVGTKSLPGVSSLNISPNPASNFIMVRGYNNKTQSMHFTMNDMTGKILSDETLLVSKGDIEKSIDVSHFKPGLYFLSVQTTEGKLTEKVVVK